MVFPLNYELGKREENNLSVKFKLLINKTDMFEAELPWLGKKRTTTQHTWESSIGLDGPFPSQQPQPCPALGTALHCTMGSDKARCPRPHWAAHRVSLPLANISLTFAVNEQDSPNITALACSLGDSVNIPVPSHAPKVPERAWGGGAGRSWKYKMQMGFQES